MEKTSDRHENNPHRNLQQPSTLKLMRAAVISNPFLLHRMGQASAENKPTSNFTTSSPPLVSSMTSPAPTSLYSKISGVPCPATPTRYTAPVHIDVGGSIYTSSLQTLTRYPDSRLAKMFNGNIPIILDSLKQHYFIDRDGKMFRHVLNFIRTGVLSVPEGFEEIDLMLEEAKYYEIDAMVKAIESLKKQSKCRKRTRVGGGDEGKNKMFCHDLCDVVTVEEVIKGGVVSEICTKGSKSAVLSCLKKLETTMQSDLSNQCKFVEQDKSVRKNYIEMKLKLNAMLKTTDLLAGLLSDGLQLLNCSRAVSNDHGLYTIYLLSNHVFCENNGSHTTHKNTISASSSSSLLQTFPYVSIKREMDDDEN